MRLFLIIIVMFSLCVSGCSAHNSNNINDQENNSYNISRVSASNNSVNNENQNQKTEFELSSFSTKIYTPNDEARQKNIQLTCSSLNETIVKSR